MVHSDMQGILSSPLSLGVLVPMKEVECILVEGSVIVSTYFLPTWHQILSGEQEDIVTYIEGNDFEAKEMGLTQAHSVTITV